MTDLEELLHATLADPRRRLDAPPSMYAVVQRKARDRRRRNVAIVGCAAAVVAVAVAGSVVAVQHTHASPRRVEAGPPTPLPGPAQGSVGGALNLSGGAVAVQATSPSALYALTDASQLLRLDPAAPSRRGAAPAPAGTPQGIAANDQRVWAWAEGAGGTTEVIDAYDATTLAHVGHLVEPGHIGNAVALGTSLFVTDNGGLLQITMSATGVGHASQLSVPGSAYGLTADPVRNRLLVGVTPPGTPPPGGFVGARVVAIDPATGKTVASSAQTDLGKESIAIVDDQVWIAGYGDVDKPRVVHLDAGTLQAIGSTSLNGQVGPGAALWAGANVLWVGDGSIACLDPQTGAVLENWPGVQGPVASTLGHAYAIDSDQLHSLELSGSCTG